MYRLCRYDTKNMNSDMRTLVQAMSCRKKKETFFNFSETATKATSTVNGKTDTQQEEESLALIF